jgi:hypothetical protein
VVAGQVAVVGGEEIAALPAELDIVADLQAGLVQSLRQAVDLCRCYVESL